MTRIIERMKQTLETGEWWTTPWWRNDKYYEDGRFAKNNAEVAFNELISVFDAKWMLRQKSNGSPIFLHQIAYYLVAEGHLIFQFLYELGMNLHTVRTADLLGDIERRLKNTKEYWESAAFELKLLSQFHHNGFYIRRNYPSGKGNCDCDFKVTQRETKLFSLKLKDLRKCIIVISKFRKEP